MSDLAIEDIIRLETDVWCALVSGDAVADARLLAEGTELETMYVSSLWCRRDRRWLNVFSQDTPPGSPTV